MSKLRSIARLRNIADGRFLFFIFCWIILTAEITEFYILSGLNYYSLSSDIFISAADALVILFPYLLLSPRWRRTVAVPMLLVPVYLYANLLYYRNFGDMMGFATMTGFQNATGDVRESAFSSADIHDLWFAADTLLFAAGYALCFRSIGKGRFPVRLRWGAAFLLLVMVIGEFLFFQRALLSFYDKGEYSLSRHRELIGNFYPHHNRKLTLEFCGFPLFWAFETYSWLRPEPRMTDTERRETTALLRGRNEGPLLLDTLRDNRGCNLIIVVVESLNSEALKVRVNGAPAMPFLDSLLLSEPAFVADNVAPQVGAGRSSDGRFILHTGLLPVAGDPVAMTSPDGPYPTLAGSVGLPATEFDCAEPELWNKARLSKAFGFSRLYSKKDMEKGTGRLGGRDAALFTNAFPLIEGLEEPFMASLNTMDMHDPYDEFRFRRSDVWSDASLSHTEKVYVEKLRQFDTALSGFIRRLKDSGLYGRSVVVITGDHNARESNLRGRVFTRRAVPLVILNCGLDFRTSAAVGQIDIFPTLLDVMGVGGADWRGLGRSILRNPAAYAPSDTADMADPYNYPSAADWKLSERMIKGRYFKNALDRE